MTALKGYYEDDQAAAGVLWSNASVPFAFIVDAGFTER